MNIGSRIVSRLNELGWKQKDLLEALPELTPQALSALIKRGSKRSELDEYIAGGLGVSVMWLVYGKESDEKSTTESVGNLVTPDFSEKIPPRVAEIRDIALKLDDFHLGLLAGEARSISKQFTAATKGVAQKRRRL